jgi:hypothetical protein
MCVNENDWTMDIAHTITIILVKYKRLWGLAEGEGKLLWVLELLPFASSLDSRARGSLTVVVGDGGEEAASKTFTFTLKLFERDQLVKILKSLIQKAIF